MNGLERVDYADGEAALTGWLARPAGVPRAAVAVFPTIMNITPAVAVKAQRLAEAGYIALIADFYGETPTDFATAGTLAQALRSDTDAYRARLGAALTALALIAPGQPMAAIGFCMGGQAVLELARADEDLVLAASFHGLLATARPADRAISARILVCHGDKDPMVPRDQVMAFWNEMDAVGADWHFHSYSNARHGFTDPASDSRGLAAIAYDRSADRQSWASLLAMLDEVLG